jgi:DNA repair photolyase
MIEVIRTKRKAAVLAPSQLACLSKLPTINLTAGCAHECLYCYARSYSQNPGQGRVALYENTLEKLRDELPRKRKRPKAVYFSPSSDAFQPVPDVLDLAYDVFEYLFGNNIGVAFLTKGQIPDRHMKLLCANASLVRAGIGLTTLNTKLLKIFEPRTAPPCTRLSQAKKLIEAGVSTRIRLDPMLPGLMDDTQDLEELLKAIASTGVKHVAVSTAFLRPGIVQTLKKYVPDKRALNVLLKHYESSQTLTMHGAGTSVIVPPVSLRRSIYNRVMQIAGQLGLVTSICACKNGDLASGSCHIAGDWQPKPEKPDQPNLFEGI